MGFFVCLNSGPLSLYNKHAQTLGTFTFAKAFKKVTDVNEKSMNAKAKINQFLLTPRED